MYYNLKIFSTKPDSLIMLFMKLYKQLFATLNVVCSSLSAMNKRANKY